MSMDFRGNLGQGFNPNVSRPNSDPFRGGGGGGGGGGWKDTVKDYAGRALGWIGDNGETAVGLAGIGATLYGSRQAGKQEDRRLGMEEEDMRHGQGLSDREIALREQEMQRLWARQEQFDPIRMQMLEKIMARSGQGYVPGAASTGMGVGAAIAPSNR